MSGISRRDALRLSAGLGAGALLAGCTTSRAAPAPTSTPAHTSTPTTTATPDDGRVDWDGFAASIPGHVLRETSSGYAQASRLYNPRYDRSSRPSAIAMCASAADVETCVRFAADSGAPFAIRSGGHAYTGYSSSDGLIIDVTGLDSISVDTAALRARVGSGVHLAELYSALAARNVGVAAGSCPTVGVAGLTLGGGIGVLSRAWGLTCDAVESVDIVTADGKLRTVDASHQPDLYWALRGGGGGSFGVVTAFTLKVRPAPTVHTFYLAWPWSAAGDVLDAWQRWMPGADKRITSSCKLLADPGPATRTPMIAGTWIGPASAMDAQLAPLLARLSAPSSRVLHSHGYADAMLLEAGCSTSATAATCVSNALKPAKRQPFAATSTMVTGTLPAAAIDATIAQASAGLNVASMIEGGVSFDSLGGAVGEVAGDATAFGHRAAAASVQFTATWSDGNANATTYDNYVRGFRAALGKWTGDAAYVNYADATIADYGEAYWKDNYPRLSDVKRAVDPQNLFHFPQSVELSGS